MGQTCKHGVQSNGRACDICYGESYGAKWGAVINRMEQAADPLAAARAELAEVRRERDRLAAALRGLVDRLAEVDDASVYAPCAFCGEYRVHADDCPWREARAALDAAGAKGGERDG